MMAQTYPIKSRSDDERLVREWGFKHVFTWTDGRYYHLLPLHFLLRFGMSMPSESFTDSLSSNAYYPPHSHRGLTTHLIRRGSLTITYPDDNSKLYNGEVKKETFGVGARIDVPAGKLHEVWIGNDGCEYVIGE